MSALRTRLDSFLRVVELDEDAAAVAHAASVRELLAARTRSDELRAELRRDGRARGPSQEWMVAELERQRLVEALVASEAKAARALAVEQERRSELALAHQKAESIRHAIARLREDQIRLRDRLEVRESDELAVLRHRRAS